MEIYPEYWLTPGVVSHTPELVTYSSVAVVTSFSKALISVPAGVLIRKSLLFGSSPGRP